jgi:hypothetical protein
MKELILHDGHCDECGRFTRIEHTYCPRCEILRITSGKSIYYSSPIRTN